MQATAKCQSESRIQTHFAAYCLAQTGPVFLAHTRNLESRLAGPEKEKEKEKGGAGGAGGATSETNAIIVFRLTSSDFVLLHHTSYLVRITVSGISCHQLYLIIVQSYCTSSHLPIFPSL